MESGREYNAREVIEAEVRILALVQIKNDPVRQEIECCNIYHTDYGGINESLGYILRPGAPVKDH